MTSILRFADPDGDQQHLVGGKGANLARLTAAGFPVPEGFTITTRAYAGVVASLGDRILGLLDGLDYGDAERVEAVAAEIRASVLGAPLPDALQRELVAAYEELGGAYVAVRSSGTAEDLADASFAGLHDTFLDIRGEAAFLDAVRRCWASMWTGRALAYRQDRRFDHAEARIAVVVQTMVESDVAGVLFTGNPLTTATDELVINASWGLGEAVVGGEVTPDEYTVSADDLTVIEQKIGSKEHRHVRDPASGSGTIREEVPQADRDRRCLDDDQVAELGRLGLRVQERYDGIPQDIEWAVAGGRTYLLQSRPVTGVAFSWDADVDAWQTHEFDDDTTWTRAWADSNWTGAKSPLFYSLRAYSMTRGETFTNERRGLHAAAARPYLRYHKAEVYYNCDLDKEVVTATTPKPFRALLPDLGFIPPSWQPEVLDADFSVARWLQMQARIALLGGQHAPHNCAVRVREYIADDSWNPRHLPDLERLSDAELRRMVRRFNEAEAVYCEDVWFLFLQHARDALCLLPILVSKWYGDEDPLILHDLLAGTIRTSKTLVDNAALWRLAERIRAAPSLLQAFRDHPGAAFFTAIDDVDGGPEFLAAYRAFVDEAGFRGHADRDLIFPRRAEDPAIDYRNFQALLSVEDPVDPLEREAAVNRRRRDAVAKVSAKLATQPLGTLRVAAFERLVEYIHDFIVLRDDQRWSLDRLTFSLKRVLEEIARRGRANGTLEGEQDHFFLTRDELYDVVDGRARPALVRAKIAARRGDWERQEHKEADLPRFMRRGRPVDLGGEAADDPEGALQGIPTSRGTVTGVARVVRTLGEIGRVSSGEILVCNSTDPGWTPVFVVVAGVVTETGGMLSHASCLSREYGLPAVQIAGAMRKIEDGQTITVHGDSGRVSIGPPAEVVPEAIAPASPAALSAGFDA